jgi:hypothetical protein
MQQHSDDIDISEDSLLKLSPELLNTLLKDHTKSTKDVQQNIFWATTDYKHLGEDFEYSLPIKPEQITGDNNKVIMPRVLKDKEQQAQRSKDKAEIFTPSWICNAQNNLVDNAWFERENVFNHENPDNTWTTNHDKITFPDGKTWKDYVKDNRLEITCGEAPYIVSRYDTTTGAFIPLDDRIGILDRKLRVVSENTSTSGEWLNAAQMAYKSTYAYEWQGDSLLLAREAMLVTFIENYKAKFGKKPLARSINYIAYIISWNVWQMDGLKCVIPDSCHDEPIVHEKNAQLEIFTEEVKQPELTLTMPCEGCTRNDIHKHNGIYCVIKDWKARDPKTKKMGLKLKFVDLI